MLEEIFQPETSCGFCHCWANIEAQPREKYPALYSPVARSMATDPGPIPSKKRVFGVRTQGARKKKAAQRTRASRVMSTTEPLKPSFCFLFFHVLFISPGTTRPTLLSTENTNITSPSSPENLPCRSLLSTPMPPLALRLPRQSLIRVRSVPVVQSEFDNLQRKPGSTEHVDACLHFLNI